LPFSDSVLRWRGPWASARSDEFLNVLPWRCTLALAVPGYASRRGRPFGSAVLLSLRN